jgi:hypothetical protein
MTKLVRSCFSQVRFSGGRSWAYSASVLNIFEFISIKKEDLRNAVRLKALLFFKEALKIECLLLGAVLEMRWIKRCMSLHKKVQGTHDLHF